MTELSDLREKWCPDCKRTQPATDFTRDARRKDGLSFYCRPCRIARDETSRRRRNGPARHRTRPRNLVVGAEQKWCPDCGLVKTLNEFRRNRNARNGASTYCRQCSTIRDRLSVELNGGRRNYRLRRRYGITVQHADAMLAEQGGLCAICREAPAVHIDHDHVTGLVRAMLCFNCNQALGNFRDRTDLMLRAVAYLRWGAKVRIDQPFELSLAIGPVDDPRPADERDATALL